MPSPLPTLDEIRENFDFFDSWEDRFQYLIDLGKKLPPFPEDWKDEQHKVLGCQSNVWLNIDLGDDDRIDLDAVSDAHIVNGLIAIVHAQYDGLTPAEAAAADIESLLKELGLETHLSPTRRNGLHAMIQRVRELTSHAG